MAKLPPGKSRGFASRYNAGPDLRGEDPLSPRNIEITLSPAEAEALHAALEDLLESGAGTPELERAYRLLGWKTLASREAATGLTGRIATMARESESLEEYEAARDEELGPIIQRLEGPENRDP